MRACLIVLSVAVLAVAFGACSCQGTPCTAGTAAPPVNVIRPEHSHANITAVQPLAGNCADEKVESVVAEVMDARDRPIPATTSFVSQLDQYDGGQVQVSVDFDTGEPGWYHVLLRLEPSISGMEFPVLVTRDRTDAGTKIFAGTCPRPMATSNRTVICDGTPKTASPEFTATELAVTGNVVWTWDGSELARWEDIGDGQFSRSPDAGYAKTSSVKLVAGVDGGELFAVTRANVERYAVRNGELKQLASAPIGQSVAMGIGLASADSLYFVAVPGDATTTSVNHVCSYSLEGDLLTAAPECQELTGFPVGVGDSALWIRDETHVRAYTPENGKLISATSSPLPDTDPEPRNAMTIVGAPLISPTSEPWLVLRLQGDEIVFEQYVSWWYPRPTSSTPTAIGVVHRSLDPYSTGTFVYPLQ